MAELAALGIASNIVQFVDFGIRLFSEARDIYESAQNSRDEDLELEAVTLDLGRFAQSLHSTATPSPGTPQPQKLSADELALQKLGLSCEKLANELLKLLDDLKVKGQHNRKWKSFRQALRHVRKEEKINKLEERLGKFQRQITTHLVGILSHQQSSVLTTINQLQETNTRLEANTTKTLEDLKAQLLEILQALEKKPPDTRGADTAKANIPAKLEALSQEGRNVARQQDILASLQFSSIRVRQNAVKKAHADTFEWIFRSSKVKLEFKDWLDSGNGIYWV